MKVFEFLRILVYITTFLPFLCGIGLWITAGKMRAQYFLAVALLVTSLFFWRAVFWHASVFPLYGIVFGARSTLSGALLAMFFTLFPVEFILPGWLNAKRTVKFLLPFFVCAVVYAVCRLCGVEFRTLESLHGLAEHVTEFNVWIRIPFFLVSLWYALMIFWIPYRVNRIMKLKNWMMFYSFGSLGITAVYAYVVLVGSVWSILSYMLYLLLFSLMITGQILLHRWPGKRPFHRHFKEKALFRE